MLFGGRKLLKHKQFTYIPQYYDPAKDKELDRSERMRFERPTGNRQRTWRSNRTFTLLLLLLVILGVYWITHPSHYQTFEPGEISIDSRDLPASYGQNEEGLE